MSGHQLCKGIHYHYADAIKNIMEEWKVRMWWHEQTHLWYSWVRFQLGFPLVSLGPIPPSSPPQLFSLSCWRAVASRGPVACTGTFVCLHLVFSAWTLLTFILELKVLEVHLSQQVGTLYSKRNVSFFFGLRFLFSNARSKVLSLIPHYYHLICCVLYHVSVQNIQMMCNVHKTFFFIK